MKFEISLRSWRIQNSKSHSPELEFKIQNLTPELEFQNSKFKILPELNFKILSAPELNFKILSAPELNFKIQNPLSSGAGEFKIQNLTLRSWNFKILQLRRVKFQNSKSHSPESEISKFKILQLRRVKFQNPPAPESEISKFKILQLRSGVELMKFKISLSGA